MKAVLTYHSLDDSGSPISLSPRVFTEHARWLAGDRIRVLPMDDLLAHRDDAGDAVALAFDDGFLNVKEGVESLLANGLPVTVFAVSAHVGGTNSWGTGSHHRIPTLPLLGWSDLAQLVARGAAIGSHTRSHAALTTMPSAALEDELLGSREDVRARLGVDVTHLAYPYGNVTDEVAAAAQRHFSRAFTTDFRFLSASDDPLRLPRLDMYYFRNSGELESWGTGRFTRRVAWCRARRALRARIARS